MGYFEHYCQLCGVSFAIARIRREGEPKEAAWSYFGECYINEDTIGPSDEEEDSGCSSARRDSFRNHGEPEVEHIAGPGCNITRGYSGHRISLEEMKGCRAIQCLVAKSEDWMPESDDEEFELEGNYFLTGVGDGSPDEAPLEDIHPARHNVDSICVSNFSWPGPDTDYGVPVHPTCFQIFKRILTRQHKKIDVQGLMKWHHISHKDSYEEFFERFSRDEDVRNASDQWWNHKPGAEYLVANPLEVPQLAERLSECSKTISGRDAFNLPEPDPASPPAAHPHQDPSSSDPFLTLPPELLQSILHPCSVTDIARLRLISRAFRQLDLSIIRTRLLEDMPWLWEAHDLSIHGTDWLKLFHGARTYFGGLKGLRNRKRIWLHVEELLRRIEGMRA